MKRMFCTFSFLFLIIFPVLAQNNEQQKIAHSGEYYYGTGTSVISAEEAKAKALDELVGQISTLVVTDFKEKVVESGNQLNETVHSILRTYSMAKLRDVQTKIQQLPDGSYQAFCYINKNNVNKIFDRRKKLIAKFASDAEKYERQANLAFALKLNYFSLILMNSLPDEVVEIDSVNYTAEIPDRINRILQGIKFQLAGDELKDQKRTLTLHITYHNTPVTSIDFKFWDGQNDVKIKGNDGLATVPLFGSATKINSLKINIKYDYFDERKEYPVVADLWNLVRKPNFTNNRRVIELRKQPKQRVSLPSLEISENAYFHKNRLEIAPQVPPFIAGKIQNQTSTLISLLKQKDLAKISRTFERDPFLAKKIISYVKNNNPEPLPNDTSKIEINRVKTGYELRRIPVLQKYPSISKFVTQYLVLDFSSDGRLQDINVSIPQSFYRHFLKVGEKGNDWPNRREIIKFIEKYRTAYLTRDLETLNMMFSDDALIIVGRRLQKKNLPPDVCSYRQLNNEQPDYELIRLTKAQYLERLRKVFNTQDDIFLNFGSFDIVRKMSPSEVYGVEMQQDYSSTTYADEGYLFLLFDFYGNHPTIYVRAWQPKPRSAAELIRTSNFKIRH